MVKTCCSIGALGRHAGLWSMAFVINPPCVWTYQLHMKRNEWILGESMAEVMCICLSSVMKSL